MKCLRCKTVEMEVRSSQKESTGLELDILEIDVCPSCAGIWLDKNELDQLENNLLFNPEDLNYHAVSPTLEDRTLCCPRCEDGKALMKVHPEDYQDVVVDICPTCGGFWLDRGEREKMKDVLDQLLNQYLVPL